MKFTFRKDIKKRKSAVSFEKRSKFFQALMRIHKDFEFVVCYQGLFLSFNKKFLNQLTNRCQYTFSKHGIIRFYHIGRHAFRANASFGTFYALQKSSW